MKIHLVWHFPENQKRTHFFAPYVNKSLKTKQESAGWPANCVTGGEKATYIREYEEKEGIKLENVNKNPARKAVTKLILNK